MGKATKVKKQKLGYDEALAELGQLRPQVEGMALELSRLADQVGGEVKALMEPVLKRRDELMGPVRGLEARMRILRSRLGALQQIVDAGPAREATVRDMVDNPRRSDGVVEAELEQGFDCTSARIEVDIRLATRIGGLARLGAHLNEPRLAAAGRFRSAWDSAQVGGARAIDYSAVRVDVSGSLGSSEAALALVEDAMLVYRLAVQAIGPIRANLVQKVICEEMSLRDLGVRLGRPVGGKATLALRDEVLEAVDGLVEHFHSGPAHGRRRIRGAMDGARPAMPEQKTVVIYSDADEVNSKAA